jgi:formylglycine-generating enzyme required for sulfatase activity
MRICLSLLMFGLFSATLSVGAGNKKKPLPDPTPRTDAILKLFVEEFVAITPGKGKFPESFKMGTPEGKVDKKKPDAKSGRDNERPVHEVTFKYSFAMAKYEVTQELYHVVMGKNPAQFQGLRNGIDQVSWHDANEFCEKATKLLRDAKLIAKDERIRLPSEAEWEYCCRAGTTTAWSFGDDVKELGKHAWFKENSEKEDPPVGKLLPNAWGLYDMHGYVWEWCADAWSPNYEKAPKDGSAYTAKGATDYVLRGGSYADPAEACRSAYRHFVKADTKHGTIGFRCVKDKQ